MVRRDGCRRVRGGATDEFAADPGKQMSFAELVLLALKVSIALLVFSVGLGTKPTELTYLVRHPGRMARALLAMNLVMPVIAVLAVKLVALDRSVAITVIALSLSPVPPILPRKMLKAGGDHAYVAALLVTAAIVAVVWIPLACAVLDRIFPATIGVSPLAIAPVVMISVVGPMIAGVAVRLLSEALADRLIKPASILATALLVLGSLLIAVKMAPQIEAQIGDGLLIALVGFVVVGLAVGHLVGGPAPSDRTMLALATAARHPGIAITIAHIDFPGERAVPAAVLLYLVVCAVLTFPYLAWRKREAASAIAAPGVHRAL